MPPQNADANRQRIVTFLAKSGIRDPKQIGEIVGGFDLNQPVYEQMINPGDRIFQFIRNPESGKPTINTGNWFCIPGASMDQLAIISGGAGRSLVEFTVTRSVNSLEGTASPQPRNWSWSGGGRGGATQIYLPRTALMALEGKGTHLDGFVSGR